MTKLKKCPFCDGKAKLNKQTDSPNYQVHCERCFCVTAPQSTKKEAAEWWNARVVDVILRIEV